jgi:glycogen debranching enzyme
MNHVNEIINDIAQNVMNVFCYDKYDPNGPKRGPISREHPIIERYFTIINSNDGRKHYLANNGWIFSEKPNLDFIAPGTEYYLRRNIMIWSDIIKLNFMNKPEDNPFLWDYMAKYVRSVAENSHALRIDNCHSTPIHVGEYFVKQAREVNPNLFVMAELFTGGKQDDIDYINHMGINFLIREGTHNRMADKMSGLLWSCGGLPLAPLDCLEDDKTLNPVLQIPGVVFDITHDNLAPNYDPLSLACAVALSASPVASTGGYDDCLNFNPSVVSEYRIYPLSFDMSGIQRVRKIINHLHTEMALNNCDEMSTRHDGNIFSIFRCNSKTGEGAWMIVRFPGDSITDQVECPSLISSLIFESKLNKIEFQDNSQEIVPSKVEIFLNQEIEQLQSVQIFENKYVKLTNFPEGSIICFRTHIDLETLKYMNETSAEHLIELFQKEIENLDLVNLNLLMFSSSPEENVRFGVGTYKVPDYGELFYAGTAGFSKSFQILASSSIGMESSIFHNIREGEWMSDYILDRFSKIEALQGVFSKMREYLDKYKKYPRFLLPKFIDRLMSSINHVAQQKVISLLSEFIQNGNQFIHDLAIASTVFYGGGQKAKLVEPEFEHLFEKSKLYRSNCTLAAGLPHFATGFMRSWGRDTFISLRGLFLVTGMFQETRDHILAFASCLRHGLIPNLLDNGRNPRFNSRDATWWFLQSIQDYCNLSDEGPEILKTQVPRLFPTDDLQEFKEKWTSNSERPYWTIEEIIQEIMTKHANGINFVEWNAGSQIDDVMKENGFHVEIVTNWLTGFIVGGNGDNCGTWMDKMGKSKPAKNYGIPATPRDGAAVEIIGLLQSTLRWLQELNSKGLYKENGVFLSKLNKKITWGKWSKLLVENFEEWFYIPTHSEHDKNYFVETKKVIIRGIYKDTVGSSTDFGDYQFRPNLVVAMCLAPELFDSNHAVRALEIISNRLLGKIGMKTLDQSDFRYRSYYNNSEESEDLFSANGFSYHNGPEWIWLTGYFFRALMKFNQAIGEKAAKRVANLRRYLNTSSAYGIPELTNKDGEPCNDSCATQAWSISSVLDFYFDYAQYSPQKIENWNVDDEFEILTE